jgi:hypothetical protein
LLFDDVSQWDFGRSVEQLNGNVPTGHLLGEEGTVPTHLRTAAAVCVLSIGLLIASAGGAIAWAEPSAESGDTGQSQSAPAPSHGNNTHARGPIGHLADTVRKTVQGTIHGVTGALTSAATAPRQSSASTSPTTPPTMTVSASPTAVGSTAADTSPTATATDAAATTPDGDTVPEAAPVTDPPANVAEPAVPVSDTSAPVAGQPAGGNATWFGPVSNSLATVLDSVVAVPAVVASLPTSTTPVADVVDSIQTMLLSVADAGTSLTQIPSNLSGLFGVTATAPPTIGGAAGRRTLPVRVAYASTPLRGESTLTELLLPTAGAGTVPTSGAAAPPAPPPSPATAEEMGQGVSIAGMPLLDPEGADAGGTLSTVERVIGAFVASASITALLAMALPGVGALLATCAAGIRIGYRQAKAGATLPPVIARFAGSGPLGVVRSGSQVALRPPARRTSASIPRSLRATRTAPSNDESLLERAI